MDKIIIKTVIRRFLEFFFWEVVLSVVLTALATAEGNVTTKFISVGLSFTGTFVYAFINILFQRRCCVDLADKKLYYKTNYMAYLIFVFVNIICVYALDNTTYAWMFAVTKAMRYLYLVVPTVVSALFFHVVMLVVIYISPYGMENILHAVSDSRDFNKPFYKNKNTDTDSDDEDDEEMFNIPEHRRRIVD